MRVGFCGPIAEAGSPAKGGMQAGSRVLIDELSQRGVTVLELYYPAPDTSRNIILKVCTYAWGFPPLLIRAIFRHNEFDALHLTILYRHFIYVEFLLVACLKIRRRPVVLHVRPGDWLLQYQRRSCLYRFCFRKTIEFSQNVLVESRALLEPMRRFSVAPVYIPSSVKGPFLSRYRNQGGSRRIDLVFLGRLVEEKGVRTALDTYMYLQERGRNVTLTLIGPVQSDFLASLKNQYQAPGIHWYGEVPHDCVRATIRSAHFFIFPTQFIGENHSNALTECMAEGVVPIASDRGANTEVIGEGGVTLPGDANGQHYADAVLNIWDQGDWLKRSRMCTRIVAEQYGVESVVNRLLEIYSAV